MPPPPLQAKQKQALGEAEAEAQQAASDLVQVVSELGQARGSLTAADEEVTALRLEAEAGRQALAEVELARSVLAAEVEELRSRVTSMTPIIANARCGQKSVCVCVGGGESVGYGMEELCPMSASVMPIIVMHVKCGGGVEVWGSLWQSRIRGDHPLPFRPLLISSLSSLLPTQAGQPSARPLR